MQGLRQCAQMNLEPSLERSAKQPNTVIRKGGDQAQESAPWGQEEETAEQATPHWGKKGSGGGEAAVAMTSVSLDFPPNFSLLLLLTHSENSDRNSN